MLKDEWDNYTRDYPCPQSYADFGFYWLISASLQRRVWYFSEDGKPLFGNLYIFFVGKPAIGKGIITREVSKFHSFLKWKDGAQIRTNTGFEQAPLFPQAPNALSGIQKLTQDLAASTRFYIDKQDKKHVYTPYAIILEELSSLFRENASDITDFLKEGYDCDKFEYKLISRESDIIRKIWVACIAGTQLDFLQRINKAGLLLNEGITSRTIFLFEGTPRFYKSEFSDQDQSQKNSFQRIIQRIEYLSKIYGQVLFTQDAREWKDHYFHTVIVPKIENSASHMAHYYGRKLAHVRKLALAIHFADSNEFLIETASFEKAAAMLDAVENKMSAGLAMIGRNELFGYSRRMLQRIREAGPNGLTKAALLLEFSSDLSLTELDTCLMELQLGHNVKAIAKGKQLTYTL